MLGSHCMLGTKQVKGPLHLTRIRQTHHSGLQGSPDGKRRADVGLHTGGRGHRDLSLCASRAVLWGPPVRVGEDRSTRGEPAEAHEQGRPTCTRGNPPRCVTQSGAWSSGQHRKVGLGLQGQKSSYGKVSRTGVVPSIV